MLQFLSDNSSDLLIKIGEHLTISMVALLLGVLVAVPIGVVITKNKMVAKVVMSIASVLQTIPSLALLAIMVPLFGVGKIPAIIAIFVYSLLPILRNTVLGMMSVDDNVLDAAKGMGMTFFQIIRDIQIKLAAPVIMSGVRLSAVYVIAWTTLASYVGAGGLGDFIFTGLTLFNVPMIILGAVPVTIMALVMDFALSRLEKAVRPKTKSSKKKDDKGNKDIRNNKDTRDEKDTEDDKDVKTNIKESKLVSKSKKAFIALVAVFSALSLTACSLPGLGGEVSKGDIVIASGNMAERQVLAEVQKQMIEHYYPKQKVSIINNLSSSMLVFQTLHGGYANLASIMYTGTTLTGELGMKATTNPKEALEKVIKGYKEKFDLVWMPTYGFENTYAFMVKKDFAKKHNLKKVSDLKNIAQDIKAGVDTSWIQREGDGYKAFKEKYKFDFKSVLPMDVGLVYSAVNSGKMDVVLGYSTDGRINSYDLQLLEDDMRIFPPYDASPVISKKTMDEHPEVVKVLLKLEGSVTSETMQKLNDQCDGKKIEAKVVAKRFLEENNYFESKKIKPLKNRPIYREMFENSSKK